MKSLLIRALMVAATLAFLVPVPAAAQQTPPAAPFDLGESWAQLKTQAKDSWPKFVEENKLRIQRLRIVRRPKTVVSSYEADPGLWQNLSDFYNFLVNRELDVWEEQESFPTYFPDRAAYYDFLDTMIPAMKDRKFERNRVLEWEVHELTPLPDEEGKPARVMAVMSITSDDTLPFGKVMIFREPWIQTPSGWYPGKVEAEPATWWERLR